MIFILVCEAFVIDTYIIAGGICGTVRTVEMCCCCIPSHLFPTVGLNKLLHCSSKCVEERERVFTYMSHTYINSFCGIFPHLKDKEADIVI